MPVFLERNDELRWGYLPAIGIEEVGWNQKLCAGKLCFEEADLRIPLRSTATAQSFKESLP